MPIREERLKKRLEIKTEQVEAREVLMCKLRDKIQKGYVPKSSEEFADVLRMVSEHARLVGAMEDVKEILERLSEEVPMVMEKYGVECKGEHDPSNPYMEKKASGGISCKHCGKQFAHLQINEKAAMKEEVKKAKEQAGNSIENMLNME